MNDQPYRDHTRGIEERVEDLLGRMTIDEKTEQLLQIPLETDENPNNVGEGLFRPTVGSILASRRGAAEHNRFQRLAVEETRLGIPIIFGQDVIHGCVTIFPHSIGQACSFDPELARRAARIAAHEARAMGYHWTFSPMIDVARDPRWGRVVEGYGEDPYLNGVFAAAAVSGYQSDRLGGTDSIAACLKHFVGYGASEGGRDYAYSDVSARSLWETYLPPYRMGVEAGAATVMSAFNDIGGVPAVANRYTLTEVLRERWGFDGFVVSDWAAVSQLEAQGLSSDPAVQTRRCLEAGNDMDMTDQVYANIPELVRSGVLAESVVDEAVRRVLRIKFRLGLFENPYFEEKPSEASFLLPESRRVADELAGESLVLLKNEGAVLPFSGKTLAVIGPAADDAEAMLGSWRCCGRVEDTVSILNALRAETDLELRYARGCEYEGDDHSGFDEAVAAAVQSELVVLTLGEEGNWSGENRSAASIELPTVQLALIDALRSAGTPVVLVLTSGRPLGLDGVEAKVDAILQVWQPGTTAGTAVVDILLGRRNPSGKLAISFPRTTGHIPVYYREHSRARPEMGSYRGSRTDALYEFGHGLSYTGYEYGPLTLSAETIGKDEVLDASVTVTNTGAVAGTETVLWYIRDPEASLTQPVRRLISFERVTLLPGAQAPVSLRIDPQQQLSYPDRDGNPVLEEGVFVLEASRRAAASFTLSG